MIVLCIALLTYGLSLGIPSHVPQLVESLVTPTPHPKKEVVVKDHQHPSIPTPTKVLRSESISQEQPDNLQEKTSAYNTASEKVIQSVAQAAIDHSPVLESCTSNCEKQKSDEPIETPTPTYILLPKDPISPSPYPNVPHPPCERLLHPSEGSDHKEGKLTQSVLCQL